MEPTLDEQVSAWNEWNRKHRENKPIDERIESCARALFGWVEKIRPRSILEIGCGTGWFARRLASLGETTAIDLASEMIAHAQAQSPEIKFLSGDIMSTAFPRAFDLIASVDTFSCIADQPAFAARVGEMLVPRGYFTMTTLNKFAFKRLEGVNRKAYAGQVRRWVTMNEVRKVFSPRFEILELRTLVFDGHRGLLRVANSTKLNRLLGRLVGDARWQAWKGRLGLGLYIVLIARRRD